MIINRLEAENVKRLKAVAIDAKTGLVVISGKNEAGKTSVLDSIRCVFEGKGGLDSQPLRNGEEEGKASVTVGDYIITRHFKRKGDHDFTTRLVVASKDGAKFGSPQKLLDSFFSDFTFDPLKFVNMSQEEMTKTLKDMLVLDIDVSKVLSLAQFDIDEVGGLPDLDFIKDVIDRLYNKRKDAGKELKRAEANLQNIEPVPDEFIKPKSLQDLLDKRDKIIQQDKANDAARSQYEDIKISLREEQVNIKRIDEQIADLKTQKEACQESLMGLGTAEMASAKQVIEIKEIDFETIDEEIRGVESHNEKSRQCELHGKAVKSVSYWTVLHGKYEEQLEAVRQYRKQCLASAKFPVKGLSISEEGVVELEGIPLEQRGTSKKILVGLAIGASLNPKLRVILIKDGNDLDSDNMKMLSEWAEEHKYQIWIERVADQPDGVSFFIEDGSLKDK